LRAHAGGRLWQTPRPMPRDLQPLFAPTSVAILGASNDPAKWGNWLARGALRGSHRRPVYLVNRNGGEVLGQQTYRSLADLPDAPELVVIAVPAAGFEQAVDDALASGAKALVGITSGLGESGEEEAARERELVWRVREAGAMLLGPNCLGVFDASSDLGLASNEFPPGSIGLISQSGNLALELGLLSRRYGLGFSRFASIGNQADLDLAELVASYADHTATDLVAI
jgi:acetate---CoA ligase (ADP-forming)